MIGGGARKAMHIVALAFVIIVSTMVAARLVGPDVEADAVIAAPSSTVLTGGESSTNETPSVLWIVLDEAPLWPLLRTDGAINESRWPGFAALAEVSTWYRDTVSPAQWTYFAVPSMLDSKLPTFNNSPTLAGHPDNVFTALEGILAMDVHETITSMCPRRICRPNVRRPDGDMPWYAGILERTGTRAATSTVPTLHFVHTLLPHRPWRLAVDLRMSTKMSRDTRKKSVVDRQRDIYQSHLRQYVATDRLIADMISSLRKSPNWDRTMVIVTADHGLTFSPGESLRDTVNENNRDAMDDVFRVPLFIKYPGQSTGRTVDCAASTMDIVPTVLSVVGVEPAWKVDGIDLTGPCPRRESRLVRWPQGSADLTTGFDEVLGRVGFYSDWVSANGGVDDIFRVGLSGSLVGTRVPTAANADTSIGWSLDLADTYDTVGKGRFSPVVVRSSGRIFASRALGANEEGLIVVNGIVVGVIPEISGTTPEETGGRYFNTNLLTRVMTPGAQKVELWIARWDGDAVELRVVGPPSR